MLALLVCSVPLRPPPLERGHEQDQAAEIEGNEGLRTQAAAAGRRAVTGMSCSSSRVLNSCMQLLPARALRARTSVVHMHARRTSRLASYRAFQLLMGLSLAVSRDAERRRRALSANNLRIPT